MIWPPGGSTIVQSANGAVREPRAGRPRLTSYWQEFPMSARIYPDVNTTSASNAAANTADHRLGEDIDTTDQISSPVLLGLGVAGAIVADLLIWLAIG